MKFFLFFLFLFITSANYCQSITTGFYSCDGTGMSMVILPDSRIFIFRDNCRISGTEEDKEPVIIQGSDNMYHQTPGSAPDTLFSGKWCMKAATLIGKDVHNHSIKILVKGKDKVIITHSIEKSLINKQFTLILKINSDGNPDPFWRRTIK
ncbi:MAG TPA: hypothetical protein DEO70_05730 [Bacteroidales bacterium]|nr:MAG: hypothetical protein A2X11_10885 [Bacteroidetes bacterium GWE2_42_24]OFY32052.1 MAG: hypothetical protein A2X09_10450 [Bacteroidetes bacterium GWF2_43_11]HBZ66320.1 hypothetical protein [Bacteroidales bacterium]